jgi:hypothetical protein
VKTDKQKLQEIEDKLDGCFEDGGCCYARGKPLIRVQSSIPKRGQYLFDSSLGAYTFSKSDKGRSIHWVPNWRATRA